MIRREIYCDLCVHESIVDVLNQNYYSRLFPRVWMNVFDDVYHPLKSTYSIFTKEESSSTDSHDSHSENILGPLYDDWSKRKEITALFLFEDTRFVRKRKREKKKRRCQELTWNRYPHITLKSQRTNSRISCISLMIKTSTYVLICRNPSGLFWCYCCSSSSSSSMHTHTNQNVKCL